jgi:hypothetical protein
MVALIVVVATYAWKNPPYDRHRLQPATICYNNLRQIDGAIESIAAAEGIPTNSVISIERIKEAMPNKRIPKCPSGGHYNFGTVGREPTCSIHYRFYKEWRVRDSFQ